MNDIRAVAFDVYGTMLISGCGDIGVSTSGGRSEFLRQAWVAMSVPHQPGAADRGVELFKQFILESHKARRTQGSSQPEVDVRAVWTDVMDALQQEGLVTGRQSIGGIERLAVEYECRINPVWPMPGVVELIDGLEKAGLILGIISNAQFFTPLLFDALFDKPVEVLGFKSALCVWSYQLLEAKPSARLFETLLSRLRADYGITPRQTLYIGNDMLNDISTARGLGMRTALFAGDRRSLRLRKKDPSCCGIRPNAVVTELGQVLPMLRLE